METPEKTITRLERKISIYESERTILIIALSDAFGMAGCGSMPEDIREALFNTAMLHMENTMS